ncbi:MAG: amino acid permease [Thaumarchaeota archaeon]|nr:amino acid permease [Nitrososphaerota archaeon]
MALKREIGIFGAASIGITNIIGAGIFVLSGIAAGLAGPSVIISFLIAGFVSLLTAFSSAELTSFVTETGGGYAFTKRAFGRFWSFLVGWLGYFDAIVGAASVSVGFAAYFTSLFGLEGTTPLILAAFCLPIAMLVLNLIGIKEVSRAASGMVIIKIFALVLILFLGGFYLSSHYSVSHYTPFFPNGFSGTLNGSAIIFFAFVGFNIISLMSEETKNPEKTIPKAILLAFGVTFVLYVGIGLVEVGVLDWKGLGTAASPLHDLVTKISDNKMLIDFVSFAALIATGSVTMGSIAGTSRASFAMSRDGLFPRWFSYIHSRFGTPFVGITVSGFAIAVIATIFFKSIDVIASIFNFGILFTYILIHLSLIKLRKKEPETKRGFKVPFYPVVPIIGIGSSIILMYFLSDTAKIASAIWIIIGLILYIILIRKQNN